MTAALVISGAPSTASDHSQAKTTGVPCHDVFVQDSRIKMVALATLQLIWSKAEKLVHSKGHVM